MVSTGSDRCLQASIRPRTTPRSGFVRDGRDSSIVTRTLNVSPGRTGFGHSYQKILRFIRSTKTHAGLSVTTSVASR